MQNLTLRNRQTASVIVFELHLFEIVVRQSKMASYISQNSSSVVCRSAHLVSHRHTFHLSNTHFFKPSCILLILICSVDCFSCRCLLDEYLKNIARTCRVDIMFYTSGPLHAIDNVKFRLWLYTVVIMWYQLN